MGLAVEVCGLLGWLWLCLGGCIGVSSVWLLIVLLWAFDLPLELTFLAYVRVLDGLLSWLTGCLCFVDVCLMFWVWRSCACGLMLACFGSFCGRCWVCFCFAWLALVS